MSLPTEFHGHRNPRLRPIKAHSAPPSPTVPSNPCGHRRPRCHTFYSARSLGLDVIQAPSV